MRKKNLYCFWISMNNLKYDSVVIKVSMHGFLYQTKCMNSIRILVMDELLMNPKSMEKSS